MRPIQGLALLTLTLAFAIHADPRRVGVDGAVIAKTEQAIKEIERVLFGGKIAEAEAQVLAAMDAARKELPEKHPLAIDLMAYLGEVRQQQGRFEESFALRSQEVALLKEVLGPEDQTTLGATRTWITSMMLLGRNREAVEAYEALLAVQLRVMGERHFTIAETRHDLATAQFRTGLLSAGLRNSELAYAGNLAHYGERHRDTLNSLNNWANRLVLVGRLEQAEPLALRALTLRKETLGDDHYATAVSRSLYSILLERMGRLSEAEDLARQAVESLTKSLGVDHPSTLQVRGNHAILLMRMGQPQRAETMLREVVLGIEMKLGAQHPTLGDKRHQLGAALGAQGRWSEAITEFNAAHRTRVKFGNATHPDSLMSHLGRAISFEALGEPTHAVHELGAMTELLDAGRIAASSLGASSARQWQQAFHGVYARLIRLRLNAGKSDEAFVLLEKAKARTLLDQVGLQNADRNGGLSARDSEQLDKMQQGLATLNARASMSKTGSDREEFQRQATESALALTEFRQKLSATYPKFQQLVSMPLATARDTASLATDAVFVSYKVDEDSVVRAAVLQPTGVLKWYELGKTAGLAQMSEALRLLASRSTQRTLFDDAGRPIYLVHWADGGQQRWRKVSHLRACLREEEATNDSSARYQSGALVPFGIGSLSEPEPNCVPSGAKVARGVADTRILAEALTRRLLAPLAGSLQGKQKLIISPDASLWTLPWDLLQWQGKPLGATFDISLTHSLSAFNIVSARLRDRAQNQDTRNMLLAFGDPVFRRSSSPSSAPSTRARPKSLQSLRRSPLLPGTSSLDAAGMLRTMDWPQLRYSRLETKLASRHFGAYTTQVFLGHDASERRLRELNRSGELARFKHLLFSTHGFSDPALPEYASVVLAGDDDDPMSDGLVTMEEWLSMRLNSDLTLLSACSTAIGKVVNGDGLVGLSYALFVAGNANTIATLWPVSDRETAHFVDRFFAHIKEGLTHSKALAATKREFMQHVNPKLRDPRYWSSFVLFGA